MRPSLLSFLCSILAASGLLPLALSPPTASSDDADVQVDYSVVIGTPPTAYGSNSIATDGDEAMWISRWNEAGLNMIRIQLPQYFFEPLNDNADPHSVAWENFLFDTPIPIPPDFTKTVTFADTFAAMKEAGVAIQLNPVYLSPWLTSNDIPDPFMGFPGEAFCTYPPSDLDEYQEYVYAVLHYLVNVIEFPPERIILDVVNEPDLACGADPVVPCFWDNWDMSDLVAVIARSHAAIQAVDSRIRMVGVAECCGTSIAVDLMDNYDGAQYLSGVTYHRYVYSDFTSGIQRGNTLKPYGLPVYCNEYGSFAVLSDGVDGALWHAYALPLMWENGICPLQFPFSETSYSADPYNSMGLMYDWTQGWTRKPAYWVYANFFGTFPGRELVSINANPGLNVLAGRNPAGTSADLAVWISNPSETSYADSSFTIQNFPATEADVLVFDNLTGTAPIDSMHISGDPLAFTYSVPSKSAFTFEITSAPGVGGVAELPSLEPDAAVSESGSSSVNVAAAAGAATVAIVLLAAAGRYARKRWLR